VKKLFALLQQFLDEDHNVHIFVLSTPTSALGYTLEPFFYFEFSPLGDLDYLDSFCDSGCQHNHRLHGKSLRQLNSSSFLSEVKNFDMLKLEKVWSILIPDLFSTSPEQTTFDKFQVAFEAASSQPTFKLESIKNLLKKDDKITEDKRTTESEHRVSLENRHTTGSELMAWCELSGHSMVKFQGSIVSYNADGDYYEVIWDENSKSWDPSWPTIDFIRLLDEYRVTLEEFERTPSDGIWALCDESSTRESEPVRKRARVEVPEVETEGNDNDPMEGVDNSNHSSHPDPENVTQSPSEKDRIEILFIVDDKKIWYPGTVRRVTKEGDCLVYFDDGDADYFRLEPQNSTTTCEGRDEWRFCRSD
jgi:hypothetical protein